MRFVSRMGAVIVGSCFFLGSAAQAALEVELHEVNTSVGLAKTAANTWKLETDPVMTPSNAPADIPEGELLSDFYPVSGVLDNTFDPKSFYLATTVAGDESAPLGLGFSVDGVDPFGVSSFEVLCLDPDGVNRGSYILVQQTAGNGEADSITDVGNPDQAMETGQVDDINYYLIASDKSATEPMPVTVDQDFFELNLVPLTGNPVIVPDLYSASGGADGALTISDGNGNTDTTTTENGTFTTSYVPEPTSAVLLGIPSLLLLKRRAARQ
jgi:hypothetical protein